jgi:hypothetical protein
MLQAFPHAFRCSSLQVELAQMFGAILHQVGDLKRIAANTHLGLLLPKLIWSQSDASKSRHARRTQVPKAAALDLNQHAPSQMPESTLKMNVNKYLKWDHPFEKELIHPR